MALRNNPLMGLFAAVVVMSATVAFGLGNAEVSMFGEQLSDYVILVFPLSLVSAYMFSDYTTEQMDEWELVAVAIPIAAMGVILYVEQVATVVSEYQPFSGLVLTAIAVVSYYVIMD